MAQESPKNSAAEIPVTSNGEVDDAHDHGFNRVSTAFFLLSQRIMVNHDISLNIERKEMDSIQCKGMFP